MSEVSTKLDSIDHIVTIGDLVSAELKDFEDIVEREKVAEQAYFDSAKEHLDGAVLARESSSGGTAVERRALAAAANRRQVLGEDDAVAFGRIDLENAETRYVGKVAIRDSQGEVLVYQWQSPAAAPYEAATADNTLGVARKRVFTAPKNKIESFEDTLFQQLSVEFESLEEIKMETDPLLDELGRRRSQFMQDIVRTIQSEQSRLIRSDKDQLLVIQGGPGTGKTAVALHRVSWLLYNYDDILRPEDILVVGPNPTFTKYIQRVLPHLGDEHVVQRSLGQLLAGSISAADEDDIRVSRLKGSATMADLIRKALNGRIKVPLAGLQMKRRNSASTVRVSSDEIEKSLKLVTSGTYSSRRIKFRDLIMKAATSSMKGFRPGHATAMLDPASVETELEKVWPQASPHMFLRDLYSSKERLRAAGATESQVDALYRRAESRIGDVRWTSADLAVLDLVMHSINGPDASYKHIVVDEAQDLSTMELRAIERRSKTGAMTIVGDIAQATSPYASKNWDSALAQLSRDDILTKIEELKIGYRVPRAVFEIAARVLKEAAPEISPPQVFRDETEPPVWHLPPIARLAEAVLDAVKIHSARGLFVGVVAASQDLPGLRNIFRANSIRWGEAENGELSHGINLVTPEGSKGLEFEAVIVVDPQRILGLTQGAKLLYIALTRTVHHLDVVVPIEKIPNMLAEFVESARNESDQDPVRAAPTIASNFRKNTYSPSVVSTAGNDDTVETSAAPSFVAKGEVADHRDDGSEMRDMKFQEATRKMAEDEVNPTSNGSIYMDDSNSVTDSGIDSEEGSGMSNIEEIQENLAQVLSVSILELLRKNAALVVQKRVIQIVELELRGSDT